ncbi:hypothetical protein [Butyrivibrio sp. WCD3002]|uniref:hypothetical protein n=1 Tax=Butyrivibrio sp. WCD3002 TaxID=1280676 RepID=UPI0003FF217C|nr:hypothetical protein [Butyrivibrio sp. WCD3002]
MYNISNEDDFKYVMQDVSRYYFGARMNYREIIDNEMAPFKFKTILERYILRDLDRETTLESGLYYMNEDSPEFRVLKQLKARVRVSQLKNGKTDRYQEKLYTIGELSDISPEEKEKKGIIVRELVISKLALFAFSV